MAHFAEKAFILLWLEKLEHEHQKTNFFEKVGSCGMS